MTENIFWKAYVRSLETSSLFLKKSYDLNEKLIKKEVTPTEYASEVAHIWQDAVKDFWNPKQDDKH